ncbi:MAG: Uridine kinase [Thelocarpon impressellum]|nr:MAG: Uridine kinase [Thelocarpon impressellum]
MHRAHYSPPWNDTSIIGIAGSSGSGKTSLAVEIVSALDRPWVVILSMDSFYKPLTPPQLELAFRNEYDLDVPTAIDFDLLVAKLRELKHGKRAEIPVYSFEKHARLEKTTSIYSPHVLILEGIYALYDPRVTELLDMKIFAEADADTCLARRITRDVRARGRDIEGVIKQWFAFVKPNFEKHVDPQRKQADIIVPRGIENKVAIDMVVKHIQRVLNEKSQKHRADLRKLGQAVEDEQLSDHVLLMNQTPQLKGMGTILQDRDTGREDFIFYFDRLATLLIEKAMDNFRFKQATIQTPAGSSYNGLLPAGEISAVVVLRAGSALETGLRRVIPDCRTGRLLIQSNYRTGEPELHYRKLSADIATHAGVLLLDPQMSSGAAALMAVKVLVDHGVPEANIVFLTYFAAKMGLNRLCNVFPEVRVVVGKVVEEYEERWIATRYFGC